MLCHAVVIGGLLCQHGPPDRDTHCIIVGNRSITVPTHLLSKIKVLLSVCSHQSFEVLAALQLLLVWLVDYEQLVGRGLWGI